MHYHNASNYSPPAWMVTHYSYKFAYMRSKLSATRWLPRTQS